MNTRKLLLPLFLSILFLTSSISAYEYDISYYYCLYLGYAPKGNNCVFSDDKICDLQEFYNGSCGEGYKKEISCVDIGRIYPEFQQCCEGSTLTQLAAPNVMPQPDINGKVSHISDTKKLDGQEATCTHVYIQKTSPLFVLGITLILFVFLPLFFIFVLVTFALFQQQLSRYFQLTGMKDSFFNRFLNILFIYPFFWRNLFRNQFPRDAEFSKRRRLIKILFGVSIGLFIVIVITGIITMAL